MARKKAPMADDVITEGFSSPAVCAMAGIPASTLDYWVRTGLVEPSIHPSTGRRATRWWSLEDLITVRAVRALRDAGCPLQTLRRAREVISNAWGDDLRRLVLCWDGSDVLAVEEWGTIRSAVRHPGQQVLHLVAIPLPEWKEQAGGSTKSVNVTRLQELAAKRAARKATAPAPAQVLNRLG